MWMAHLLHDDHFFFNEVQLCLITTEPPSRQFCFVDNLHGEHVLLIDIEHFFDIGKFAAAEKFVVD